MFEAGYVWDFHHMNIAINGIGEVNWIDWAESVKEKKESWNLETKKFLALCYNF